MLPQLLVLASVVAGQPPDTGATLSQGASLYHLCQAEVKLMSLPSLTAASETDVINGSYCMGYLNGFTGSLRRSDAAICTHDESMGTLVRVYVTFMEKNPQLMDQDRTLGLRMALRDAYPCPANLQPHLLTTPASSRSRL